MLQRPNDSQFGTTQRRQGGNFPGNIILILQRKKKKKKGVVGVCFVCRCSGMCSQGSSPCQRVKSCRDLVSSCNNMSRTQTTIFQHQFFCQTATLPELVFIQSLIIKWSYFIIYSINYKLCIKFSAHNRHFLFFSFISFVRLLPMHRIYMNIQHCFPLFAALLSCGSASSF